MKIKIIVYSVFVLLLVSTTTFSVKGITLGTDASNDVVRWYWDTSANIPTTDKGISKPEIDIQTLEWDKNTDGNVTVSLAFAGTPSLVSNSTFYWVMATHEESNLTITLWAGGFTGYSTENPGFVSVIYGMAFGIGGTQNLPVISGNKVVWTLPRQVNSLNMTSFKYEAVDLNLPDDPPSTWKWSAMAWTGTAAWSLSFTDQDGEWWLDEYDSTKDTNTPNNGNGNGDENATTYGFELISLISLGAFVIIKRNRRK